MFNASIVLTIIVTLSLLIVYWLYFNWIYVLQSKLKQISMMFKTVQYLIFAFIIYAAVSRTLCQCIQIQDPTFHLLDMFVPESIFTISLVAGLIALQLCTDLWTSTNFKGLYNQFLNMIQLRGACLPISLAYSYNEQKLANLLEHLKTKSQLDERMSIMSKNLEIWHHELNQNDLLLNASEKISMESKLKDEKGFINDYEKKEEETFRHEQDLEAKIEESKLVHRMIISFHLWLRKISNPFSIANNLFMIHYIYEKNNKYLYIDDLNIINFIVDDTRSYVEKIKSVKQLYDPKIEKEQWLIQHSSQVAASNKHIGMATKFFMNSDVFSERKNFVKKITRRDKNRKIDHEKATNVLLEVLEKRPDKSKNTSGISKNCITHKIGKYKIFFYNTTYSGAEFEKFTNFKLKDHVISSLKLLGTLAVSKWQSTTLFILILYCVWTPTLFK